MVSQESNILPISVKVNQPDKHRVDTLLTRTQKRLRLSTEAVYRANKQLRLISYKLSEN